MRLTLEKAGLAAKYWECEVDHTSYFKNRLPPCSLSSSPFEELTGNNPTLKLVREFGCAAFVYDKRSYSKIHARAFPSTFNGHSVYLIEKLADR